MAPDFRPFDPRGDLHKARHRLPHWRQEGATYFVTFRLHDSMPREARDRLAELRQLDGDDRFVWIDGRLDSGAGSCLLATPTNAATVVASLRCFDGERYLLGTFIVMPNHVHVLVQPATSFDLSSVVRGWKSFTARELEHSAGIEPPIWQTETFDRIVRDEHELRRFTAYIRQNPAAAWLEPGTYLVGEGTARWLDDPIAPPP